MRLPPRVHHHGSTSAFSLIELLGVIAVMGLIIGTVAVNMMASLPRAKLNATVHDIAAAVSGARSDAIARNGEFRIYYDLDANSYQVRSPLRIDGTRAQVDEERHIVKQVRLPESIDLARVTIDGIEYEDGIVFARFSPLGSATGHTINLVQAPSREATTIEVLTLTGLVRFYYHEYQRPPVSEEDFE